MNGNIPDLIHTPVILQKSDALWSDQFLKLNGLEPRQVVVITQPFESGSAEESLLTKMLSGCQLTEEQYNIIQLDMAEYVSWHLVRDRLKPQKIILLGTDTEQLGVTARFMPNQLSCFNDCVWIPAASLPELIQNQDIKAHLWNYGLKPAFIDKVYG